MPRTAPVVPDADVFAAVVDVISEVGPSRLTLARVGAKAGLTAGALVQRFGSKHGLLSAFVAQNVENVAERFAVARRRHPDDPPSAAVAALTAMVRPLADRRAFVHHLAFFVLELADPELRPHVVEHAAAVRRELTTLLADAALARHLQAVHQGALITWAVESPGGLVSHVRRHLQTALARAAVP